jgi:hypothetical protein
MSSELERVIGVLACPLPLFNENLASALKIPEALRPIVADCRRIVMVQASAEPPNSGV